MSVASDGAYSASSSKRIRKSCRHPTFCDTNHRTLLKDARRPSDATISTVASYSQASYHSFQSSPSTFNDDDHEWRTLGNAMHSHLLPDDIGRTVVIVRDKHRSPTAFQEALGDDDDDDLNDGAPWF